MASLKGIYDKLISVIKTSTVVDSGSYSPSSTDIIPVYDYQNAVSTSATEKMAVKKFVRATDLGGGGSSSTETILYSNLTKSSPVTTIGGTLGSFTIPGGTIPANSMLYLECKAYSYNTNSTGVWGVNFLVGANSLGQTANSNTRGYAAMIKLININAVNGTNNTVIGPLATYPDDYANVGTSYTVNEATINWSVDQTITVNVSNSSSSLPSGGVVLNMFRIKLAVETPTP